MLHPGRSEPMTIAGLARATEKDIERCYEAVKHAPRHRIHTFLATSDIHVSAGIVPCFCPSARLILTLLAPPMQLQHKLRISRAEAVERAVKAVRLASSLCSDVEFSTEDGGRSERSFLCEAIGAVIEAGATTINVPDTVGYTLPHEYGDLFAYLIANTKGADKVIWSTHCHNDLGLAVANTLSAVRAGARQVEVTINGLGERAGNTSLEEVIMTIQTRPQHFHVRHGIDTTQLIRSSKLVSHLTGMVVQPNKAIVGANAFAHESGIHQDGMLKDASTYEIMTPASVGVQKTSLVLGKHSGRSAYSARLKELGFTVTPAELDVLVERFKVLADEKKIITDADIESIVYSNTAQAEDVWTLLACHVFTGTEAKPTATVTLKHKDGEEKAMSGMGCGPIDAVYNAIRDLVGRPNDLLDFSVRSVTDGQNALGEVTIKISPPQEPGSTGKRVLAHLTRIRPQSPTHGPDAVQLDSQYARAFSTDASVDPSQYMGDSWEQGPGAGRPGPTYSGVATDKDIIIAAARAYVAALNRMLSAEKSGGAGRILGAGEIGASV